MHRSSMMVRLISVSVAIIAAIGTAQARSYRVSPRPCPAPADAPSIVPERDTASVGADFGQLGYGVVILDVPLAPHPNGELFKRFLIDVRSGAIISEPDLRARVCE